MNVIEEAPPKPSSTAAAVRPGRVALIDQLLADRLDVMFGNPGTVEQGFLDVLRERPQMRYILTLQESVAVMAADAYARCLKKTALVQIHSTPGLGNAIGALYQAMRGHSPLVVIGGDAGIRYQSMDAQMAGDLVAMAEPVTKWATMVVHPSSILRTIRRAVKIASTPPRGPVYVCLPMDVLDQPCDEEVFPTPIPSTGVVPDPGWVEEAAAILAQAAAPMMFVGDGVAWSHAQNEVAALAELAGAEIWNVDAGEVNVSYAHPLAQGQTGHMFGAASRATFGRGDVNLICGTYIAPEVFPDLGPVFAPRSKVIHVDLDAYEIGKNHRVDLGAVSDPKKTLAALAEVLTRRMTPAQKRRAAERCERIASTRAARQHAELERDRAVRDELPIRFSRFMEELAPRLPSDAIVFDEALTNAAPIVRYLEPVAPESFFQTRGGSLGTAMAGAIGLQLARPDVPVVAISGDGGALYTIQALWTASRHRLAAKFVICNNRSYRLLEKNIEAWWKDLGIAPHGFPRCFDLSDTPIRFDLVAAGFGVRGERVERIDEIGPAIDRMLASEGAYLLDVVLA